VTIGRFGGPEALSVGTVPTPEPGPGGATRSGDPAADWMGPMSFDERVFVAWARPMARRWVSLFPARHPHCTTGGLRFAGGKTLARRIRYIGGPRLPRSQLA
jgi:hypothetical protein